MTDHTAFPEDTIRVIEQRTRCKWAEITGRSRERKFVSIRATITYFLRRHVEPQWLYAEIGDLFGRDHTTVMHAEEVAKRLKEFPWTDPTGMHERVLNALILTWPVEGLK